LSMRVSAAASLAIRNGSALIKALRGTVPPGDLRQTKDAAGNGCQQAGRRLRRTGKKQNILLSSVQEAAYLLQADFLLLVVPLPLVAV
jgi:hypothetical protein